MRTARARPLARALDVVEDIAPPPSTPSTRTLERARAMSITLENKGSLRAFPSVASMSNMSEMSAASVETQDERSADEVREAKEATLASDRGEFIEGVEQGKFVGTKIANALGDVAVEVREAALSVGRAALSDLTDKARGAACAEALLGYLTGQGACEPMSHGEDNTHGAAIALYAHAAQLFYDDAGKVEAIKRIVEALRSVRDAGAFIGARAIGNLAADVREAAIAMLGELKSKALTGADIAERRQGAAAMAGICKGVGVAALADLHVVDEIKKAIEDKKDPVARAGALLTYAHMCRTAGRGFEPYAIGEAPIVFTLLGDRNADVREAANLAQAAVVKALPLTAMKLLSPALNAGMQHKDWQSKLGSLHIMGDLANRVPQSFMRAIPDLFPSFLDTLFDTHPKVSALCEEILPSICCCVKNAEVLGMMDLVLSAIRTPQKATEDCLDKLMETTFVNSMDAPSLAVILPVILRGLRERTKELKQKAATTFGNICALVDDPRDLLPFIPVLLPELEKAEEHSHPDLREAATRAKTSLMKGIDASQSEERKVASNIVKEAINGAGVNVDVETQSYAAALGGWVMDSAPLRIPPSILSNDIKRELTPVLESAFEGNIQAIEKIANVSVMAYKGLDESALLDESTKDYIVDLQGIILAFAGRVLLQRTNFTLERGRTYGIVGQNGTGKTTLLNRVAAKDIAGFPEDVSVYYIQHEIMSDKEETIVDFMVQMVPEGVTRDTVVNTLKEVGFDDEKMAATIQSLSGGWRMKLAIARAMLWDADVLLLDEPTNHLDTSAIAWLTNYLKSLTNTTICLVSHDYDFLAEVLTDVIHLSEKTLTYYPMSFRDFQSLKPEIVAALPSSDNAIAKQSNIEGGSADGAKEAKKESGFAIDQIGDDQPSHIKPIRFPEPGDLEGVKSRAKCVMYMKEVSFGYPGTSKKILNGATVKITQNSRAALVGLNGAGKTTLLKLLIGALQIDEGVGEVWRHHNLRLSYIAQHSMQHLEESLENTPLEYLQNRFYNGRDKEIAKRASHNLSKDELATSQERGNIMDVIGRVMRGKHLFYEVRRAGREENDTDWEMMSSLERKDPYVMKMVRNFDEKLKAMQSGMDLRPLTKEEVRIHLENFGIDQDLAMGKIKRMSGGQKSRLVLAAAMWTNPHIIALDEPTNYLDNDTLAALTKALIDFKGGVITISHNEPFVNAVCDELWRVGDGVVVTEPVAGKAPKKLSVAERRALKAGIDAEEATMKEAQNNKKLTAKEKKEAAAAKKAAAGPVKDLYGRGK